MKMGKIARQKTLIHCAALRILEFFRFCPPLFCSFPSPPGKGMIFLSSVLITASYCKHHVPPGTKKQSALILFLSVPACSWYNLFQNSQTQSPEYRLLLTENTLLSTPPDCSFSQYLFHILTVQGRVFALLSASFWTHLVPDYYTEPPLFPKKFHSFPSSLP